jgi:uracil-DNA glycosylase
MTHSGDQFDRDSLPCRPLFVDSAMHTLAAMEEDREMVGARERLRAVVLNRLESLERAGVMQLPRAEARPIATPAVLVDENGESAGIAGVATESAPAAMAVANEPAKQTEHKPVAKSGWQSRGATTLFETTEAKAPVSSPAPSLEILQREVAACTKCSELASTRTQTVFGVGKTKARLCFMGEAPGADEDRLGEPFVGRGGQLLNKIIEACRLKREDVYILNMLKCRPPGNRNPLPHELLNCRPFLERQLELIQPEFICCLGAVAAQNLLKTTTPISKLRGKLHAYRGAKVVCTFHPAYLLRNPAAKKDAWEDMKFLFREMGVEL